MRGFFAAFDAATGHFAWRFYTVPGDPRKPSENEAMKAALKTWGGDFWKRAAAAAVWDGMAYDPDAEPGLRRHRQCRAVGPEIPRRARARTISTPAPILAVDLTPASSSGISRWCPNDNWDYDSVQQLMLADLTIKGRPRKVIMQASKNGFF